MNKKTTIILLIVLATAIISVAGMITASSVKNKMTDNLVDVYAEQELLVAKQVAKITSGEVEDIREKLNLIAKLPEVKTGDTETCNKKLTEVLSGMEEKLSNIGRMNAQGVFDCSVNPAALGVDGKKIAHLKQIIEDPKHEAVLGYLIPPAPDAADPQYVTSLHVPRYDDNGNFIGTLGGAINFGQFQEQFLKDIKFLKQGYPVVQDDNGDILMHPRKDLMGKNMWSEEIQKLTGKNQKFNDAIKIAAEQGKEGKARYTFEGKEKVLVAVPANIFPNRRWVVSVTVPIEDIKEAMLGVKVGQLLRNQTIIMSGVLILVFIIILTYIIKTVFNPIKELAESMDKISKGDLSIKLKVKEGKDEVGLLVRAFNRMVASVKILLERGGG